MKREHLLGLVILGLGACQTAQPATEAVLSSDFGEATRTNIAAMAIVPTDEELNNRFIPADRQRAARVMEDYRSGDTQELESLTTSGD